MLNKGLLKVSYLKKMIAKELLNYNVGDFIATISKYQEKLKSSRGSVQIAIKELQIEKAILLRSKGASGTQIIKIDYNKLLSTLEINAIIGAMTLPYSIRYEGLASAFVKSFYNAPFRFAWSFQRGALNRINSLMHENYDFIILSKMAAMYYKNIYDIKIILELEDISYNMKHVWITKKDIEKITDGMRIGIDKSSFDQFYSTNKAVENLKVKFIDVSISNIISEINIGNIDAAIWSIEMLDSLKKYAFSKDIRILNVDNSIANDKAVVVAKKDRGDINKIIKDYISTEQIKIYQDKIINGDYISNF